MFQNVIEKWKFTTKAKVFFSSIYNNYPIISVIKSLTLILKKEKKKNP